MFYGIIKRLEENRGFGFIQTEGRDVYFHATDIGDEVFRLLQVNQPVTFEYAPREKNVEPADRKGPRAVKLSLIERMPGGILPRDPENLAPRHHPKARQRKATWKRRIELDKPKSEAPDSREGSA
jgi:cold shock CspA family protein